MPLAQSAIALTADGELIFLGMSREATLQDQASRAMWCLYRFARHGGAAEAMADAEACARAAGAALAGLLREQGYGEAEIAKHLCWHEAENPNDYWRRWTE